MVQVFSRNTVQVFSSWISSMTRDDGLAVLEAWQGLPGFSELWTVDNFLIFTNMLIISTKPGEGDRWRLGKEVEGRRENQWRRAGNCWKWGENCWKLGENCWKCMKNCWKWWKIAESGWKSIKLDESGWWGGGAMATGNKIDKAIQQPCWGYIMNEFLLIDM